mmetsp:Transcript_6902/g.12676  ORF Transcript_6902/g.12676 Transcript_6902/m.12676 type:complete len:91 (+) Transcript_6902:1-273(+)
MHYMYLDYIGNAKSSGFCSLASRTVCPNSIPPVTGGDISQGRSTSLACGDKNLHVTTLLGITDIFPCAAWSVRPSKAIRSPGSLSQLRIS